MNNSRWRKSHLGFQACHDSSKYGYVGFFMVAHPRLDKWQHTRTCTSISRYRQVGTDGHKAPGRAAMGDSVFFWL